MRAATQYAALSGGDLVSCLDREPPLRGSEAWWEWWYECCPKPNPHPKGSVLHARWVARIQTNPFRCRSPEWCRWEKGCAGAPVAPLTPWWVSFGCACCGMFGLIAVLLLLGVAATTHNPDFVGAALRAAAAAATQVARAAAAAGGHHLHERLARLRHRGGRRRPPRARDGHVFDGRRRVLARCLPSRARSPRAPTQYPRATAASWTHELRLEVRLPASSATEPYVLCVAAAV